MSIIAIMMTSKSQRLAVAIFAITAGLVVQVDSEKEWWQTTTVYQIWPRSFKDSDGNGIGDLNGITSKLGHVKDMGIETIWISPFYVSPLADSGYDVTDYYNVDPIYGTLEDFDNLIARAKNLGIKVLIDYVPNHTSTENKWFKLSEDGVDPYTDYYVWHKGILDANGTRQPPNNWVNVFNSGTVWEWSDKRQAYYLHQFDVTQADLNFNNPAVLQETKDIMTFWLDRGIDGFRVDAVPYLFEDAQLRDEPKSGRQGAIPTDYVYLLHIYTKDLIELYPVLQMWRDHIDAYSAKVNDGRQRIICSEGYANITMTSLYYDYGSYIPMNFFLIRRDAVAYSNETLTPQVIKDNIDLWLDNMPKGGTPNWVISNHDRNRLATRYGSKRLDIFNFLLLLLPGIMTVYNGDEIGMTNTFLTWEETEDSRGCNSGPSRYSTFSRDPERTPYQWDSSTSAGFSTSAKTFLKVNENYHTLNLAAQKVADKSHYKNFQATMKLRNTTVAKDGNLTSLVIDENVFAMSRELAGHDPLLVVFNWANSAVTFSLDDFSNFSKDLEVLLSSVDSKIKVGSTLSKSRITLPGYEALVLTSSGTSCSDCTDLSKVACLIPVLHSFFNM